MIEGKDQEIDPMIENTGTKGSIKTTTTKETGTGTRKGNEAVVLLGRIPTAAETTKIGHDIGDKIETSVLKILKCEISIVDV